MMLACNCLNVIIEPETNDFLKVTDNSLELEESEKKDCFFNQEIQQIQKLNRITKKISGLVATRLVGSRWIVHRCLNCNVHTHAVHRDRGAAFVLVACKLLTNEAIAEIKNSEHYSRVFDIRVMECNPKESGKSYDTLPSSDSDSTVSHLRQRVNEFVNRETVAVEDKIRRFTEEHLKALDEFRDRVFKEHHMLKKKILEHKLNITSDNETSTNVDTNLPHSNLTIGSPARSVPESIASTNSPLVSKVKEDDGNNSPGRKLSSSSSSLSNRLPNPPRSFDSEVLFPLEDMEDDPTFEESDFEESDQEDMPKEETPEPVRQKKPMQLAKSLPVNIPVFMSTFHNHQNEDNDDESPDESMDIAASIKALAKSIQGGTVFGELPRPRFSSQI